MPPLIDLTDYVVEEERTVVLNFEALIENSYDEVIESCRPGISWELGSLDRCCTDHVVLVYRKRHV